MTRAGVEPAALGLKDSQTPAPDGSGNAFRRRSTMLPVLAGVPHSLAFSTGYLPYLCGRAGAGRAA